MARYIDADKLKSLFLKNYSVLTDIIREQNDNGAIIGISEVIGNTINNTPTADVQEVKHGKWIFENGYITCSNCKCQPYKQSKTIDYYNLHNYCPHCGAKMDGEEE